MFASIIHAQFPTDKLEAAVQVWQETVAGNPPTGWQEGYFVADRTSGHVHAVAIWDSEANARAYESSGRFQQDVRDFSAHLSGPPSRSTGDVMGHSRR
ncbi:MAG: hypothetical protein R3E39_23485 [Anaerolineae bacterium]